MEEVQRWTDSGEGGMQHSQSGLKQDLKFVLNVQLNPFDKHLRNIKL